MTPLFSALYIFMLKMDLFNDLFFIQYRTSKNNLAEIKLMEAVCKQINSVKNIDEIEKELENIKKFISKYKI